MNVGFITSCRPDASGSVVLADNTYNTIWQVTGTDAARVIYSVVGFVGGISLPRTSAPLFSINAVWGDSASNLYLTNPINHILYKITNDTGQVSVFAGTYIGAFNSDNRMATLAALNAPRGVSGDVTGNIYISDYQNHRIRRVSTSNVITTVAGTASGCAASFNFNNVVASSTSLCSPGVLAMHPNSNLLYFVNYQNSIAVLNIQAGTMSFVSGSTASNIVDTTSLNAARYKTISALYYSVNGLYSGESVGNRVRSIDIGGNFVMTVAGTSSATATAADGQTGTDTKLDSIVAICGFIGNKLYFIEDNVYKMRYLDYFSYLVRNFLGIDTVGIGEENVQVMGSLASRLMGCHYNPTTDTMYIAEYINATNRGIAIQARIRKIQYGAVITTRQQTQCILQSILMLLTGE
ncbi:hypothetical protein EON65_09865 [archaeon]|nr:MAG: hypothetical protein EON65_09865 [archaeon]